MTAFYILDVLSREFTGRTANTDRKVSREKDWKSTVTDRREWDSNRGRPEAKRSHATRTSGLRHRARRQALTAQVETNTVWADRMSR